ncbi:hypothetical protein WJ968_33880 [Achromobacter xylosoxidans]
MGDRFQLSKSWLGGAASRSLYAKDSAAVSILPLAASSVQFPPRARARAVAGGGHVGVRQLRQPRQQFGALGVGADVATIEQDVALFGQRRADLGQLRLACVERGGVQLHRAQAHAAFGAVADDVDRVDATAAAQRVGDLLQAIAGLVQHDDFGAGPDLRDQLLVVLDLVVHEHDLATRRFRGHGHAGQVGAGWARRRPAARHRGVAPRPAGRPPAGRHERRRLWRPRRRRRT